MEPFVLDQSQPPLTSSLNHSIEVLEEDTSSQSTEEDLNALFQGLEELEFGNPRLQRKINQMELDIWTSSHPI